jgi:lysyl-tRNA synthetase class 1
MHWSDSVALLALKRVGPGEIVVIGSGISLSGPVHVGHAREFITAALIEHAVKRNGGKTRFIAFADDMDPLRKVYPFLPSEYNRWVGCPLYRIPDPWCCHSSYADHFLDELLEGFTSLGIAPDVIRSSEMYNSGKFFDLVHKTLIYRKEVEKILDEIVRKQSSPRKGDEYWPYKPECPKCFSLRSTKILGMSGNILSIRCDNCEESYEIDLCGGGGKLSWRCDWPMRWAYLGITVEPFGHDHASAGGSYDTGKVIAKQIYGVNAPVPVPYGWVHFKSGGAMHSSSGKAIPIAQLAKAYPPEIIWWMFARRLPKETISFDPEETLLEEARLLRDAINRGGVYSKSVEIVRSVVGIRPSLEAYPLDHLVLVSQLAQFQPELALKILKRSQAYRDINVPVTQKDLDYVRKWLELYGEYYRIRIREPNEPVINANPDLRPVINVLRLNLQQIDWRAQAIHNTVHETAKNVGVNPHDLFAELYMYIMGQNHGPKIGWLFESLGRDKVLQLLSTQ